MITMQYRIGLPADYDMDIIRRRIAERGHLTDKLPGLAFKAYLYAGRDAVGGENLYAPFYLWHSTEGMNAFLGGAGFAGVVASFGRPLVRTWSVWRAETARDLSSAGYATREIAPIPAHAALDAVRAQENARLQTDLDRGALASLSAFDPASWTLLRFRLWRDLVERPQGDDADVYAIGHISQPQS
ncbi:DUF4865 family protein [Dyella acidiphila]|uniref:DUF4865 family protein n=1 Tax=Dyella acidiphila TaxID=2775866 RepID=A0ABR9G827_9GAMM|nr:DUF4865 family protein [Dyella acidiphila]MBE1160207.1 DUF4865 family protein [Dyella acidiphila]